MMKMKINITNIEKIKEQAAKVEKLAKVRTLDTDNIVEDIETIEKRLTTLLPKKDWKGLRFEIDQHAQNFPSSYTGYPESTQYVLTRGSAGWFITGLGRTRCKSVTQYICPLNIGERAKEIAAFVSKPQNF